MAGSAVASTAFASQSVGRARQHRRQGREGSGDAPDHRDRLWCHDGGHRFDGLDLLRRHGRRAPCSSSALASGAAGGAATGSAIGGAATGEAKAAGATITPASSMAGLEGVGGPCSSSSCSSFSTGGGTKVPTTAGALLAR